MITTPRAKLLDGAARARAEPTVLASLMFRRDNWRI